MKFSTPCMFNYVYIDKLSPMQLTLYIDMIELWPALLREISILKFMLVKKDFKLDT